MAQSSKWNIDLAGLDSSKKISEKLSPIGYSTASSKPEIAGSSKSSKAHKQIESKQQDESTVASAANADMDNLKLKKAWDAALAPAKNIPMNAFMLWMSGNSVQIFSILMTAMLLFNSAKATVAVSSVFQKFAITPRAPHKPSTPIAQLAADPLLPAKLTYIIMQLACLGLGVWKCGKMGLLPTAQSDWLAFMGRKESRSGGSRKEDDGDEKKVDGGEEDDEDAEDEVDEEERGLRDLGWVKRGRLSTMVLEYAVGGVRWRHS